MTSTHCGTCGDPLFEQDGTTFCPGCHGGPEGVEGRLEAEPEPVDEPPQEQPSGPAEAREQPRAPLDDQPRQERTQPASTGDAERDLQRALSYFAAQAAETRDPRQAREHLAAAREAAAALEALR